VKRRCVRLKVKRKHNIYPATDYAALFLGPTPHVFFPQPDDGKIKVVSQKCYFSQIFALAQSE
jgi:hypothetical protein